MRGSEASCWQEGASWSKNTQWDSSTHLRKGALEQKENEQPLRKVLFHQPMKFNSNGLSHSFFLARLQ